jgi:hypothetical protein
MELKLQYRKDIQGSELNKIQLFGCVDIGVGLRKASNVTCYNGGNPRNAVTPQPTKIFGQFIIKTLRYLWVRC